MFMAPIKPQLKHKPVPPLARRSAGALFLLAAIVVTIPCWILLSAWVAAASLARFIRECCTLLLAAVDHGGDVLLGGTAKLEPAKKAVTPKRPLG